MLLSLLCSVLITVQPGSYLLRTATAIEHSADDIPAMQPLAEAVAKRICAGGKLYAGGNASLIAEISGRAGGLMLVEALGAATPGATDAVLYFVDKENPLPATLANAGAQLVIFGEDAASPSHIGRVPTTEGLSPTHAMAIQAWLFTAELIAACTRENRMPVIYETIGLYGGTLRMQQYHDKGIFFHEKSDVPRLAVGDLSYEYIKRVAAMLRRCAKEHRADLDRAAAWSAQAVRAGKQPTLYSMGHMFPDEVAKTEIGATFHSEPWNEGFSYLPQPPVNFAKGQAVLYLGYQHPPQSILQEAKTASARAVYVSVVKDRDFPTGNNVVWIDPMWPFADACVPIPGYDIPALPASGVANAAIAWEIYRLTQEAALPN